MRIILLMLLFMQTAWAQSTANGITATRQWRAHHGRQILVEFSELLSIPNLATDARNIQRNAEFIQQALQRRGMEATLWTAKDAAPLVYGRLVAAGATRTIGLYAHYDGQPVNTENWASPPWNATLRAGTPQSGARARKLPEVGGRIDPEWRLYARSAGDDKLPIIALLSALDALKAETISPKVNLVLMFEGEEEAGSTHLSAYLKAHKHQLTVDTWLIFDGPVHPSRKPMLAFGVRGYTGFDLTVYGANRALHSGHYGNWAPNPALELARLLASMKDANGEVLVRDFYADLNPPAPEVVKALDAVPDMDDQLRNEYGLARSEANNALLVKRLMLPSLNIRGLASARVGAAARNLIPARATASLDLRLVAGNDPEQMLDRVQAHIRRQGYFIVQQEPNAQTRRRHPRIARMIRHPGYPAAASDLNTPMARQLRKLIREASGQDPVIMPTLGGSLPLYHFNQILHTPVIIVPTANHDDNQHAANENVRLGNLFYAMDLMAAILTGVE